MQGGLCKNLPLIVSVGTSGREVWGMNACGPGTEGCELAHWELKCHAIMLSFGSEAAIIVLFAFTSYPVRMVAGSTIFFTLRGLKACVQSAVVAQLPYTRTPSKERTSSGVEAA